MSATRIQPGATFCPNKQMIRKTGPKQNKLLTVPFCLKAFFLPKPSQRMTDNLENSEKEKKLSC